MIDENYHIEDIDDIFDSQDKTVKEAATKTGPVKARIIFEDSTSSKSKVEEPKSEDFQAYEEAYDQEGSEGTSEKKATYQQCKEKDPYRKARSNPGSSLQGQAKHSCSYYSWNYYSNIIFMDWLPKDPCNMPSSLDSKYNRSAI